MNGIFKGFLPEKLKNEYLEWAGLTYADVIRKVYREPLANRFLAKTANFIASHLDEEPLLAQMVEDNFRSFFDKNLVQYEQVLEQKEYSMLNVQCSKKKVGFVGGISYQFSAQLKKIANEKGYEVNMIMKSPIDGLIGYHS